MSVFNRISPVELSVATSNFNFYDADLSSHLSENAVGVMIIVYTPSALRFGVRCNGSTDDFKQDVNSGGLTTAYCGVDASQIIELNRESTSVKIYLVGEFVDNATFFTNAVDAQNSTDDTWEDLDLSSDCPDAKAILLQLPIDYGVQLAVDLRCNGSTDDLQVEGYKHCTYGWIVGCDANQVIERYSDDASNIPWGVVGYITDGVVMQTNLTDVSLGTTGAYSDITAFESGATAGFIRVVDTSTTSYKVYIRTNGQSDEVAYNDIRGSGSFCWAVELDANSKAEGKIENAAVDFYRIGYVGSTNSAPTAPTSLLCEAATNPQAVSDLTPEFSAILNDPDSGDVLTHVAIQVATDSGFASCVWDSGWIDITDTDEGDRCPDVSYAGTTLAENGLKLYWRIKAKDDDAEEGAWSDVANFRMNLPSSKTCQESMSMDDGDSRVGTHVVSESLSMSDTLERNATKALPESMGMSDGISRAAEKKVTDSMSMAATAKRHATPAPRTESMSMTDDFERIGAKLASESMPMDDGDHKTGEKTASESMGMADAVKRDLDHVPYQESLGMSDSVSKAGEKTAPESMSMADSAKREGAKLVQESLGMADAISKAGEKTTVETMAMDDGDFKGGVKTASESLAMQDRVKRDLDHIPYEESMSMAAEAKREGAKLSQESMAMSDPTVLREGTKVLSESMPMADRLRLWTTEMWHSTELRLEQLLAELDLERLGGELGLEQLEADLENGEI